MHRCIELALNGWSYAAPNPMVGAVLVENEKILAEGYHKEFGGPHAEVNCLNQIPETQDLSGCTLYVNLEPCSHHGKTPPCSDLIIKRGVGSVVVGSVDPNPMVAGKGIQKLQKAGIAVTSGILEEECHHLNRRFFFFHSHKRPFITLKWAETADGFIGLTSDSTTNERKITGKASQMEVHKLRATHMSILIGAKTALADDPLLDNRLFPGKSPIKLIIAPETTIPEDLKLWRGSSPVVIFTNPSTIQPNKAEVQHITTDRNAIDQVIDYCVKSNIISILVEGGTFTHRQFIQHSVWNQIYRFVNPNLSWKSGTSAPEITEFTNEKSALVGRDQLTIYQA